MMIAGVLAAGMFFIFWQKSKSPSSRLEEYSKTETFYGEIAGINTNSFSIKFQKDILSNPIKYETIDFVSNQNTLFKKYEAELKSEEEFLKDQEGYEKEIAVLRSGGKEISSVEAPSWQKQRIAVFQDLKIGDVVEIYAYKLKNNLIAQKVIIKTEKMNDVANNQDISFNSQEVILSGLVKEKTDDAINLEVDISSVDNDDSGLQKVYFTSSTKIILKNKKTDSQFQKELAVFKESLSKNKSDSFFSEVVAPDWYTTEIITSDKINQEDKVVINAMQENDKLKALRIEVLRQR